MSIATRTRSTNDSPRRRTRARLSLCTLGLAAAALLGACDDDPTGLRPGDIDHSVSGRPAPNDASPHRQGFVRTAGATIHYLDWGGSGPPLVLLTGRGESAHVFDDLAPKLTSRYRVIAITRRGYGQSSRPLNGYGVDTLVDDDVAVLDRLRLDRVYLAGHSIGALELTRFAVRHPQRVARMVYLDGSLNDRTPSDECRGDAPGAEPFPTPVPAAGDLASFDAYVRFQRRLMPAPWSPALENVLWHAVERAPDGRVIGSNTDASIVARMVESGCRFQHEFGKVRLPTLAIGAAPGDIRDLYPWLPAVLDGDAAALAQYIVTVVQMGASANLAAFAAATPGASTLLVPNTNHYVFVRDEARVVAALRAFLPAPM